MDDFLPLVCWTTLSPPPLYVLCCTHTTIWNSFQKYHKWPIKLPGLNKMPYPNKQPVLWENLGLNKHAGYKRKRNIFVMSFQRNFGRIFVIFAKNSLNRHFLLSLFLYLFDKTPGLINRPVLTNVFVFK